MNLEKRQYDKAIENFGRAIAQDQNNARFLLGLGEAYEGLGQNDAARELYMKVVSKSPKEPDAYMLLGGIFSKRQDHQKSAEVFKEGLSYCPTMHGFIMLLLMNTDFWPKSTMPLKHIKKPLPFQTTIMPRWPRWPRPIGTWVTFTFMN